MTTLMRTRRHWTQGEGIAGVMTKIIVEAGGAVVDPGSLCGDGQLMMAAKFAHFPSTTQGRFVMSLVVGMLRSGL